MGFITPSRKVLYVVEVYMSGTPLKASHLHFIARSDHWNLSNMRY